MTDEQPIWHTCPTGNPQYGDPPFEHLSVTYKTLREMSLDYRPMSIGWNALVEAQRLVMIEIRHLYGDEKANSIQET